MKYGHCGAGNTSCLLQSEDGVVWETIGTTIGANNMTPAEVAALIVQALIEHDAVQALHTELGS